MCHIVEIDFWLSLLINVASGLMTKQYVLLLVCDLVWLCVPHTVVHVVTKVDAQVSSVQKGAR